MTIRSRLCIVLVAMSFHVAAESPRSSFGTGNGGAVTKLLDLDATAINEMSGMVKSRRYKDVYWVHNDSGDMARLFALTGNGRIIVPEYLRRYYGNEPGPDSKPWPGLVIELAANIDWEDIAIDDDAIYIADMGNNGNSRRDLGIYVIEEPNPRETARTRSLKFIPVRYPDQVRFPGRQWHYDCEALFVFEGKLYFLTKNRQPGQMARFEKGTALYRLDSERTDEVNLLTRVQEDARPFVVTGADTSPDGQWLAVLCYTELWLFPRPAKGDRWLSGKARRLPLDVNFTGQAEAITWRDAHSLLIGNEEGEWFTVDVNDIPDEATK